MDDNSSQNPVSKCSCDNQDSFTTEKKCRSFPLGFFHLKKSQSLNLQTNSKKLSRASKWIMKLNCTKTDEVYNNDVTAASSSNSDACYKEVDESENSTSPVVEEMSEPIIVQDIPPDEPLAVPTRQPIEHEEAPSQEVGAAEAPVEAVETPPQEVEAAVAAPTPQVNSVYTGGVYTNSSGNIVLSAPFVDIQWIRSIHEDCDEAARLQRAREIEQGVEAPPNFRPTRRVQLLYSDSESDSGSVPRRLQLVCSSDLTVDSLRAFFQNRITLRTCPLDTITGCHTQVDFIHCLVPDLLNITNCSFYWGKMDRYEAERLLEGKPEGTFLLRDSAQEEFLFSVSFRKYNRSLHARIEQWNHKFSFDSHDPGVYTSDTVCGLIEHYKDPSSCMFFEPMLTWPLHRNFSFSLQHMCRAVIVSSLSYDDINVLQLPKALKSYLKEYHYRQKVRVERFDDDIQWIDLRSVPP